MALSHDDLKHAQKLVIRLHTTNSEQGRQGTHHSDDGNFNEPDPPERVQDILHFFQVNQLQYTNTEQFDLSKRVHRLSQEASLLNPTDVQEASDAVNTQMDLSHLTLSPCLSFLQHACLLRHALRSRNILLTKSLLKYEEVDTIFVLAYLIQRKTIWS